MRTGALAVLAAASLAAAGCGGSGATSNGEASKPPAQVLADAVHAAAGASAVHVSGSIVSGGSPLTVDLHLVRGTGGKGRLAQNGLRFELIRIGDRAYIRGSDAFYRQFAGSAAAGLLRGRWLVGSATGGDLAALVPLTDIDALFREVTSDHGRLRNEGETTYQGQRVVVVRDLTKGGRLYVAATGPPYPVAIVGGGESMGTISFDGWNEVVPVRAPKGAIDLSKLPGR